MGKTCGARDCCGKDVPTTTRGVGRATPSTDTIDMSQRVVNPRNQSAPSRLMTTPRIQANSSSSSCSPPPRSPAMATCCSTRPSPSDGSMSVEMSGPMAQSTPKAGGSSPCGKCSSANTEPSLGIEFMDSLATFMNQTFTFMTSWKESRRESGECNPQFQISNSDRHERICELLELIAMREAELARLEALRDNMEAAGYSGSDSPPYEMSASASSSCMPSFQAPQSPESPYRSPTRAPMAASTPYQRGSPPSQQSPSVGGPPSTCGTPPIGDFQDSSLNRWGGRLFGPDSTSSDAPAPCSCDSPYDQSSGGGPPSNYGAPAPCACDSPYDQPSVGGPPSSYGTPSIGTFDDPSLNRWAGRVFGPDSYSSDAQYSAEECSCGCQTNESMDRLSEYSLGGQPQLAGTPPIGDFEDPSLNRWAGRLFGPDSPDAQYAAQEGSCGCQTNESMEGLGRYSIARKPSTCGTPSIGDFEDPSLNRWAGRLFGQDSYSPDTSQFPTSPQQAYYPQRRLRTEYSPASAPSNYMPRMPASPTPGPSYASSPMRAQGCCGGMR